MKFQDFLNEAIDLNEKVNVIKSFSNSKLEMNFLKLEGNNIHFEVVDTHNITGFVKRASRDGFSSSSAQLTYGLSKQNDDTKIKNYIMRFFDELNDVVDFPFLSKSVQMERANYATYKYKEGWNTYKRLQFISNKRKATAFKINASKVIISKDIDMKKFKDLDSSSETNVIQRNKIAKRSKSPTEAPYNMNELNNLGIHDEFAEILIANQTKFKNTKRLTHEFTLLVAKKLNINADILKPAAVVSNVLMLMHAAGRNTSDIDYSIFTKVAVSDSTLVIVSRNETIEFDKKWGVSSHEAAYQDYTKGAGFHSKFKTSIEKLITQRYSDNKPMIGFMKEYNVSSLLLTEVEFTIYVFEILLSDAKHGTSTVRGDIHFGMGSVRRDMLNWLISKNFIDEVKDGSTKRLYLPGAEKIGASNKALVKSHALYVKENMPTESSNGYVRVVAVSFEEQEKTVYVHVKYDMASRSDRDDNGTPTNEYDKAVGDGLRELFAVAKGFSTPEVSVMAKEYPGWGGIENEV